MKFLLVLATLCAAHDESLLTEHQRQLNLDSFDKVWTTIRDKHWDPEFGGLDWDATRVELRPEVADADTMGKARALMNDMIQSFGFSHFAIIPAGFYEDISGAPGTTGIDVRIVDGRALVTSLPEGSSGAMAGVRPGWEILRVGETDIPARLEKMAATFEGRTWRDAAMALSVMGILQGPVGKTITVEFLDGWDERVIREIPLWEPRGNRCQIGHLPAQHVWIDARPIDGDVGYIAFNRFLDAPVVMPVFNEAVRSFRDAPGIVIDLRGNGGGMSAMAMGMAGWFVREKDRHLGTLLLRNLALEMAFAPRPRAYTGSLAILVDGLTISAAEFFAGGLQDLGRARVFGSRTAGAALPSVIERLPNGDGFQYVLGDYITAGGERLEGKGVAPDREARVTRQALLEGRDPALEEALRWIRKESRRSCGGSGMDLPISMETRPAPVKDCPA
jgi:carboxyl-terminal processing protease